MKIKFHLAPLLFSLGLIAPGLIFAQDPSVVGQWATIPPWPIYSVNTVLLPTGKVLFYSGDEGISGNDTRSWDPVTGNVTALAQPGYNTFCTGHAYRADGGLLVTGGHIANNVGLPNASIYDPFANTWLRVADMNAGRWYPTATSLPNGDVLTVSGYMTVDSGLNPLPQVYSGSTWRNLTNAQLVISYYPWMFVAPNGKVFCAGTYTPTRYLDTSGTGLWTYVADSSWPDREYGSAAMYDNGKVLILGGGGNSTEDPNAPTYLPTNTAEVIDLNAPTPAWRSVSPMAYRRRHPNATLLPDGTVLVSGGDSGHGHNNLDYAFAVHTAELWNPATETFTAMASSDPAYRRIYHSSAILLPDARILTSGGNSEFTPEIFSPPFLFKGTRPVITSAPGDVGYNQAFTVPTPDANTITSVAWIGLGAVTHAFDENQRINKLTFTPSSSSLKITSPVNSNLCPPGHYMLFILKAGVPSVAKIIRIGAPTAPASLSATAVSRSQINLAWVDRSSAEKGDKIERSPDGITFTQIAKTPVNSTSYSITTGLAPATTYYFRIRAYNAFGNSAYTAVASATTLP